MLGGQKQKSDALFFQSASASSKYVQYSCLFSLYQVRQFISFVLLGPHEAPASPGHCRYPQGRPKSTPVQIMIRAITSIGYHVCPCFSPMRKHLERKRPRQLTPLEDVTISKTHVLRFHSSPRPAARKLTEYTQLQGHGWDRATEPSWPDSRQLSTHRNSSVSSSLVHVCAKNKKQKGTRAPAFEICHWSP